MHNQANQSPIAKRPGDMSMPMLRILEAEGEKTQRQLAAMLGLTFAGVSFHLRKLATDGWVERIERRVQGSRGRPSATWDIDRARNQTIGIVLTMPRLICSVCNFADTIQDRQSRTVTQDISSRQLLKETDAFIAAALARANRNGANVRQVFIGMPGHLDPDTGRILDCPVLPALSGIDFEAHIQKQFGLKATTQSSSYAVYAGESDRFGTDRAGMLVMWELGIGVLVGCNRDLYNYLGQPGQKYRGLWDIGHTRIVKGGKRCTCGQRGCLEAYASGEALLKEVGTAASLDDFIAAARQGDRRTQRALCAAARLLGEHLAGLVQLMGIDRIVIAGPLAEVFDIAQDDFNAGLSTLLDVAEVHQLGPVISLDSPTRTAIGAGRMAKTAFLQPEMLLERRRNMMRVYTGQKNNTGHTGSYTLV